jgi:hypothetical protein
MQFQRRVGAAKCPLAARAQTGVKLGLAGWQMVRGLLGVEVCAPLKQRFGKTSAEKPERRASRAGGGAQHDSVLKVVRANSSSPESVSRSLVKSGKVLGSH